jgi:fructose-bisphosphate aldolase class I
VTGNVLDSVFAALFEQKVSLEGMLLKPNMVISGKRGATQAAVNEVARATVRCLRRHAPAAVAGIVFLSGGQDHLVATTHQHAFTHRAKCDSAAAVGRYTTAMETESAVA